MKQKLYISLILALASVTSCAAHTYSSGTEIIYHPHGPMVGVLGGPVVKDMFSSTTERLVEQINAKSKKTDIAELQIMLMDRGFLIIPEGVALGVYGDLTRKAVIKFKNVNKSMRNFGTGKENVERSSTSPAFRQNYSI